MNSNWIPFVCTGLLLWLWFLNARIDRSSISPTALFLGYWFFAAFCPMLAWLSSLLLLENMDGYVFVAVAGCVILLATILFRPTKKPAIDAPEGPRELSVRVERTLIWTHRLIVVIAFLYPVAVFFKARSTLGVQSLLDMPSVVSEARYTMDWNPGFLINGLNTFVFTAAALSGLIAADAAIRRRHMLAMIAGILPGAATYYLTAARTGLVFSAVFWLGSYLAASTYLGQQRRFNFRTFLFNGLLLVVLTLPVIHLGYMIRTDTYEWEASKVFLEKSLATAFGHMPVLGHWLASDPFREPPAFELKTLAGITEKVGLATRDQGLYNFSYSVGTEGAVSNIYTVFRPLLEDGQGYLGGCALLFLFMGIANFAWHRLRRGRILAFPFVFGAYVFVLWGIITSIYIYLSTLLAVLLSSVLIMMILTINHKAATKPVPEELPTFRGSRPGAILPRTRRSHLSNLKPPLA